MSTTPGNLVKLALLDSGVIGQGQTASAEDTNNAFTRLNMMWAQWNRRRWLVWNLRDISLVSTGAESYTVGTGQDFNIQRPAKLEDGCYLRMLQSDGANPVDIPMRLLPSHEDYTRIRLKNMGTFPWMVFYDSAYPVANVFFWPVPEATIYELHILVQTPLTAFTSLSQVISVPDEYQAAILYNLQLRLRMAYRLPVDPAIVALAKDSLNVIRQANAQIPMLRMPGRLVNRQRAYNVFSDGW